MMPQCSKCGSVEWQRVARVLLEAVLPPGERKQKSALALSGAASYDKRWFSSVATFDAVAELTEKGATLPYADESLDVVISLHVLHRISDFRSLLKAAVRVLKPGGFMLLSYPSPATRKTTESWDKPNPARNNMYRIFGMDFEPELAASLGAAKVLALHRADPVTGDVEIVYLASKSADWISFARDALGPSSHEVRLLEAHSSAGAAAQKPLAANVAAASSTKAPRAPSKEAAKRGASIPAPPLQTPAPAEGNEGAQNVVGLASAKAASSKPDAKPAVASREKTPIDQLIAAREMQAVSLFAALTHQDAAAVANAVCHGLHLPTGGDRVRPNPLDGQCLHDDFCGGALQINDLWVTEDGMLTWRAVPPERQEADVQPITLIAYQAEPFGGVARLGDQTILPDGPAHFSVALGNRYAPVLLIAHDAADQVLGTTLLPFPSLSRGGEHAGELALLGASGSRFEDLRRISDMLLWDAVGLGEGSPDASLATITVELMGATGTERFFSEAFQSWLQGIAAIRPRLSEDGGTQPAAVRAHLEAALRRPALTPEAELRLRRREAQGQVALHLSPDALPTLSVLFSRRLRQPASGGSLGGAMILTDGATGRPAWSISFPPSDPMLASLQPKWTAAATPRLVASGDGKSERSDVQARSEFPLAIRFPGGIAPSDAAIMFPSAPDGQGWLLQRALTPAERDRASISVVLPASLGLDAALAFLASLRSQSLAPACDLLVQSDGADKSRTAALRTVLQRDFPDRFVLLETVGLNATAALNAAASQARGLYLLLVTEPVLLSDPRTLEVLVTMLQDPQAASAGACFVSEAQGKGRTTLQQHTAGMFPAQISLISLPNLVFNEPGGAIGLTPATYPVVANPFRLVLVRAEAWQSLGGLDAKAYPHAGADLDFGLRGLRAGWRHLCTSAISILLEAQRPDRRQYDPVGTAFMPLASWQEMADKVTLLRALQ
jgi:hypothetical protein